MRSLLLFPVRVLYHIWFYVLVAIPIFIFSPVLLLFTISENTYPQFFWLARNIWANIILYGMGCPPRIQWEERLERGKSYMLIANHTSMLDIMLMLRASKNPFVFVGKKELAKIPVFGFFYKRVCIMVDRQDSKSRTAVYRRARRRLQQGLSICIFPEGGVPEEDILLGEFKEGAFKMAIAHGIPVVPMIFYDNKRRFPFEWDGGSPGPLRVKVHSFLGTGGIRDDGKAGLRDKARAIVLEELKKAPPTGAGAPEALP